MKLLYYSTAYHSGHGGSNHSRAFVQEASSHPDVEEVRVFPPGTAGGGTPASGTSLRDNLRNISLFQIAFFYRRNRFHLEALYAEIESWKPTHLVMRLDSNLIQIGKIKKRFPSLVVATEVNASPFDESFKNIAFRNIFRNLEKNWMREADHNFFVSDVLRSSVMGPVMDPKRDHVVHNGYHPDKFSRQDSSGIRTKLGLDDSHLVIGYAGTLDRHKKVPLLIEAFSLVRDHESRPRMVIVGDGPAGEELRQLVKEKGLEDHIIFTGWIPHDEMPRYLSLFDIAVHHKAMDYMSPLKLFEYAGMGIPTVGPDTPAVREVFTDGIHLLLSGENPASIRTCLLKLMDDPDLRTTLSRQGARLVQTEYTWKQNAAHIIRWLQQNA